MTASPTPERDVSALITRILERLGNDSAVSVGEGRPRVVQNDGPVSRVAIADTGVSSDWGSRGLSPLPGQEGGRNTVRRAPRAQAPCHRSKPSAHPAGASAP